MSIFDEQYRVIAVEHDHLVVRGIFSGDVLTIVNTQPGAPVDQQNHLLGKLIALTDVSAGPLN
jgi:hypothetical protein